MNCKPHSEESKRKISNSLKGFKHSDQTKFKLSLVKRINKFSLEFLKARSLVDKLTKCWNWLGTPSERYPTVSINGKKCQLSRLICSELKGGIEPNQDAMHICDNSRCVNPDHIIPGSRSDNITDCANKGRMIGFKGQVHTKESKIKISNTLRGTI